MVINMYHLFTVKLNKQIKLSQIVSKLACVNTQAMILESDDIHRNNSIVIFRLINPIEVMFLMTNYI